MSSDESGWEGGTKIYRVKRKPWRDPSVRTFLRTVDLLYEAWRRSGGDAGTLRGAWVRSRLDSNAVSTTPAVKGLPQNAYDHGWFSRLGHVERQILRIGAKMDGITHYSFAFPEEIYE